MDKVIDLERTGTQCARLDRRFMPGWSVIIDSTYDGRLRLRVHRIVSGRSSVLPASVGSRCRLTWHPAQRNLEDPQ